MDRHLLYMDSDDQKELVENLRLRNNEFYEFYTKLLLIGTLAELILVSILNIVVGVPRYPFVLLSLVLTLGNRKWTKAANAFVVLGLIFYRTIYCIVGINLLGELYLDHAYGSTLKEVESLDNLRYNFKTV